ncbi:hypothetical protein O181_075015 [Austropuccinia psidii MF-1]|uniref:Alpha-amylase n=1 Tax=Austropuccinia psidii MF-1 TaxID=1389203 RepID=A0A9Q3IDL2_9BASI|nr:hypothetical protein [Austropuccinia psidii MF-1]
MSALSILNQFWLQIFLAFILIAFRVYYGQEPAKSDSSGFSYYFNEIRSKSIMKKFKDQALIFLNPIFNKLSHSHSHSHSQSHLDHHLNLRLDNHLLNHDVTVQLFQWHHLDVANECENFLAPFGYRYAQISPPQEHILGHQWWTAYQPVSYELTSKRGTEADFDQMIKRCKAVGVGIIVDVIFNHMTAGSTNETSFGTSNSPYKKYNYPNLYSEIHFHKCRPGNDQVIQNWSSRHEIQNCELLGLADLNTANHNVQRHLKSYLKRLNSKGVSGIRVDAAKHILASELAKILSNTLMRVVQEVIFTPGEVIKPNEYMNIGRLHLFQASIDVRRMFLTDGIAHLGDPIPWGQKWGEGYLPSSHSQVFVTNWDIERQEGALRIDHDPKTYLLCQSFLLVWNYGQVDVFSGYNFTNFDDPPQRLRVHCGSYGWRCEHRHPMVIGAMRLRAASLGEPVANIATSGKQRLRFNRGSKVFVAFNNDDTSWSIDGVPIGLPTPPPGKSYSNLLTWADQQTSVAIKIDNDTGQVLLQSVNIPPRSAIGIMI